MAGAGRGSVSASHRLLSLCSSSLTSPYTGNLSVLWCYWSEPVGLSAGKEGVLGAAGGVACGVDSALGTSVPSGHCQRGHTEQRGMEVADEVPKPKGLQCQRVPGLAALAAIENVRSEKQGGEDCGLDGPICMGGTVLHARCV